MRATPLRYFCEPPFRYRRIAELRINLSLPLLWLQRILDTVFILLCGGEFADCEPEADRALDLGQLNNGPFLSDFNTPLLH